MTDNDLTILVPRKDLTDERWNRIDAFTASHAPNVPRITGQDPWFPARPFWSMSRAINEARKSATTPKLLITPCDYIHHPETLALVSKILDEHPWWGPYQSVHQLWDEPTEAVLNGATPELTMPGDRTVMCMACIAVRADVFDDVGGMDPRFEGYSPEDMALRIKLTQLHGEPPAPQLVPVFELWTDRSARPNFDVTGAFYHNTYLNAQTPEQMRAVIASQPRI